MEMNGSRKKKQAQPAIERVVGAIKKDLLNGKFLVGQKYWTERELCEKLEASRTTVREALRMVQVMGYLELRPGKGAFVRQPSPLDPAQWISFSKEDLLELVEIRAGLEPLAARMAAGRATDEELCLVLGATALFERACRQGNAAGMVEADRRFHEAIAEASHNETLIKLCRTLNDSLVDCRAGLFAIPDNGEAAIREHQQIADALTAHSDTNAFTAMADHLENVQNNILEITGKQR